MMKIMTEKEVQDYNDKIELWWNELDQQSRWKLYHLVTEMDSFIQRLHCEHEWFNPNTYENDFDKTKMYCNECSREEPLDENKI